MAKIEIWSKDIINHKVEFLNDPQHLYLIYTNDKGYREILRGGSERTELFIVKQVYEKNKNTYDWNDGTHIGQVIASENEQELAEKWNKMWQKAQEINQKKYDYEFLTQNSNTSVVQLTKAVGLDNKVKDFLQQNSLWAPAYNFEFEHSPADRFYDVFMDGINKTASDGISQFKKLMQQNKINPYKWIIKIALQLELNPIQLLQELKKLIEQLIDIENISKDKPILVIQESETGRNELFINQLTGEIMNREEFADQIQAGDYPGYTVANINEIATPMSKPDENADNNLG